MMLVQLKWSALASSSHSQTGTGWAERGRGRYRKRRLTKHIAASQIGPPMAASPLQTGPERCFPHVCITVQPSATIPWLSVESECRHLCFTLWLFA
ncbi:hypothetical protein H9L39_11596 [Fusarium oxysporum f. sp. albedinis]|nr:hypothetical protein H9L39_11596 [Fusarium oxysporum f. sp. albedinis]